MNKPRAARPPRTKIVECPVCNQTRAVRKDSTSTTCKACAARKSVEAALIVIRAKTKLSNCKTCGATMPARLGYTYCSVECRMEDKKVDRVCKCCGETFRAYKSALDGKTNASGNFCGRACYEKWMCNGDRVTGRGSQWAKIRQQVLARHPFCALCGTSEGLQVHHIVPFRMTQDNSDGNLVPLCIRHHKVVESITHDVEFSGSSPAHMKTILGSMLAERSAVTAYRIKKTQDAPARNMADR